MKTTLNETLSFVSIPTLYDNISMVINGKKASNYDCTKVCVGESILNDCERYVNENGGKKGDFSMLWVMYGPKATLQGYEVEVEEGWCEL